MDEQSENQRQDQSENQNQTQEQASDDSQAQEAAAQQAAADQGAAVGQTAGKVGKAGKTAKTRTDIPAASGPAEVPDPGEPNQDGAGGGLAGQAPFSENEMRLARFLIDRFPDHINSLNDLPSPVDAAIAILSHYADLIDQANEISPYVAARVVYHPLHPTETAEGTYDTVEDGAVFHNGVTIDDVLAATVTRVVDGDTVNLMVYSDGGGLLHKQNIKRGSGYGQWDWPGEAPKVSMIKAA